MLLKVKPSEAQERGAAFLLERDAGALFYATGSGKSVIQIMVAFAAIERGIVDKFVIVATVSSALEIKNDFKRHTDIVPFIIDSLEDVETFASDLGKSIGVVRYNKLMRAVSIEGKVLGGLSEQGNNALGKLFNGHKVGFSFDEVHTLKNPKASVTAFYRLLRGHMTLCFGVTATGVMSNIYDLYHILNFIKPGCLGSVSKFNSLYVDRELKLLPNGRRIWEVLRLKNLEALEHATASVSLKYYPERDVEFIKIESELSNKEEYLKAAKGILEEIEKEKKAAHDAYKRGGDSEFTVKAHSARLVDLQYVVNRDEGKKQAFVNYMKDYVEQGVLVFCAFHDTVDIVSGILGECKGIEFLKITGLENDVKRKEAKEWFCSCPKNKVLIISKAGGQSLNLQATSNVLFFDIPFGAGSATQVFGRVVREYSEFKSFKIAFLVTKGTVDEYKYDLLSSNKELFMKIFRNEVMPESAKLGSYNKQVINSLKRDLLWKYGSSGRKF